MSVSTAQREERDLDALDGSLSALDWVEWYRLLFVLTTEQSSFDDEEDDE